MPFCNNCGSEVKAGDTFCGRCGAPQTSGAAPRARPAKSGSQDPFSSLDPNTASVLCYIPFLGWIASIIILASERFRKDNTTRFHAFQGLYLFVAWLIYDWVIEPLLYDIVPRPWVLTRIVKLSLTSAWIFLLYKTSQREIVRVPFIGDLADKSVAEQR